MKILPVFNIKIINNTNKSDYIQPKPAVQSSMLQPLLCDTVTFGRSAEHAEALRALMAYGIPDMYSGKTVIDPKVIENLCANNVFSKPIKNLLKIMRPYEESLHTVESQFWNIVQNKAKFNSQYTLSDIVQEIAPEHNAKLIEVQQPIFDELTEMAKELPPDLYLEFENLMNIVYKKINHKPVVYSFNAKEFHYKLQRIADENKSKNNYSENILFKNIMHLAKKLPKDKIKDCTESHIKSKVKRKKNIKNNKYIVRKRAEILTEIELLAAGTSLKSNQELTKLLAQTRAKIYNLPIIIPFNRKSFIYELRKITDKTENQKLAHKMILKATSLPTSHENLSAFVMKCVEYSSQKIGYNIFSGSTGSIDHLIPFSKKGKDVLSNYGISSAYYNSERAERSMIQQLKKYPETYANCQKLVDRLIELCNKGVFRKVKLPKTYIYSFAKKMYALSPPEQKMVLDLNKLK